MGHNALQFCISVIHLQRHYLILFCSTLTCYVCSFCEINLLLNHFFVFSSKIVFMVLSINHIEIKRQCIDVNGGRLIYSLISAKFC